MKASRKRIEGAAAVARWIRRASHPTKPPPRKLGATEAARLVGVARQTIYAWIEGRKKPSLGVALKLEQVSGGAVPVASWGSD